MGFCCALLACAIGNPCCCWVSLMNLYEPPMNLENEKQLETKEIMNLMNLLLMLKGLLRGVYKGRGNRFIRFIRFIFENCLLDSLGETALAASVSQFSAMCADPSQPRPAITGTAKTEERRGDSGGRFDTRFCPNPNPIVRWGKVGPRERSDRSPNAPS